MCLPLLVQILSSTSSPVMLAVASERSLLWNVMPLAVPRDLCPSHGSGRSQVHSVVLYACVAGKLENNCIWQMGDLELDHQIENLPILLLHHQLKGGGITLRQSAMHVRK